jgi:lipase (class 2)
MSVRLRITCMVALCAMLSSTAMVLFAGIAAACSGAGGGGCEAPTASTGSASSITSNSATLSGSVNAQGCTTYYVFEWGKSSSGPFPDSIEGSAGKETFPKAVSTNLTGLLQPSTQYYFRLSAINSEGKKATGSAVPFKTSPACTKPTVTTEAASFIGTDNAFLNGKVQPNGCSAEYVFEYGLAGSGSYIALHGTVGVLGPFSVSVHVDTLIPNKLYTYRLSAKNTAGNTDGSWVNFSASPSPYDPILFVHGYKPTQGGWYPMISSFRDSGWPYPYYLNDWTYDWSQSNVTTASAISSKVNLILSTTGKTKVDLITHSMGSLSARYYIKNLGGAAKVDDFVSLGGLNHGTTYTKLFSLPYVNCSSTPTPCNEMVANSTFLNALNSVDETPGSVQYFTEASSCDPVVDVASVKLNGALNEEWNTPASVCVALDGHSALRSDNTVIGRVKSYVK